MTDKKLEFLDVLDSIKSRLKEKLEKNYASIIKDVENNSLPCKISTTTFSNLKICQAMNHLCRLTLQTNMIQNAMSF